MYAATAIANGQVNLLELLLEHGALIDVEWDMIPKIHELNFEYSDVEKSSSPPDSARQLQGGLILTNYNPRGHVFGW